jgi:hypothetical protein
MRMEVLLCDGCGQEVGEGPHWQVDVAFNYTEKPGAGYGMWDRWLAKPAGPGPLAACSTKCLVDVATGLDVSETVGG